MKKHRPRHRKTKPPRSPGTTVEQDEPDGEAFYHGGAPGVGVGDYLLPRNLTGDPGSRAEWPEEWIKAADMEGYADGDWVFVTTNLKLAARHAVLHRSGHGQVYKVAPQGSMESDPARVQDCYRCSRAEVLAIKAVPDAFAQRIRAENPRNFEEAASNFEQSVGGEAGHDLVKRKVREIVTADLHLSPQFIATELFAYALRLMVPTCDNMWVARALSKQHWQTIMQSLPAQMQPLRAAE